MSHVRIHDAVGRIRIRDVLGGVRIPDALIDDFAEVRKAEHFGTEFSFPYFRFRSFVTRR